MRKSKFTEQQIIGFLKQAEAGMAVAEICRKACSSSTASQKLKMPSSPLLANLEYAGLDAGDNEWHQQGRSIKPPIPTEALPGTDTTWFSSTRFICRDQRLCGLRLGWRGR